MHSCKRIWRSFLAPRLPLTSLRWGVAHHARAMATSDDAAFSSLTDIDASQRGRARLSPQDIDLVIYHKNCPDGFGAAWCAYAMHGDAIEYYAAAHGDDPPEVCGRNVAVFDFSFKLPVHRELSSKAKNLIVLDHHITAKENLQGVDNAFFDMDFSGARLAWHYMFPGQVAPKFIQYIEDRDIWKWRLPSSRQFSAGLSSVPMTFESFSTLRDDEVVRELIEKGVILTAQTDKQVQHAVAQAQEVSLFQGAVRAKVVNYTVHHSEVGNALVQEDGIDVGMIWAYQHQNKEIRVSLRSLTEQTNVSVMASRFGGGGHARAAGFSYAGDSIESLLDEMRGASLCE